MQSLDVIDGPLRFEGALSLEKTPEGIVPWRLNRDDLPLLPPELVGGAKVPSGVRLVLQSDTRSLTLVVSNDVPEHSLIDLAIDGRRIETRRLHPPGRLELIFQHLPAGQKRIELYLPNYGKTVIQSVAVDDTAAAAPWIDRRPRWVTHGSSLTMCRRAISPMRAWPALVASDLDWHCTQLGFGGQCMIDPIVARTIAKLPADVISLCLGINTQKDSFTPRTWPAAALGFIQSVRDGHPHTPLLIFSPMISPPRETTPGVTGLTLVQMRLWLSQIVATLKDRGDSRIAYVDGLEVFGPGDVELLPDELHPSGDGIELMGQRIARIMRTRLPEISAAALCR